MTDDTHSQTTSFDADRQYLGSVYAKALFGLAQDAGKTDEVMQELESFVRVLRDLPQLRNTLESPRLDVDEREKLIDKAIGGRASTEFTKFLKVLSRKGRMNCLVAIRDAARILHDESSGRLQATMTTAVPVDDSLQRKVGDRLSQIFGKQVVLATQTDPDIIGGLVVRVGDTVFDGSITNQLKQARSATLNRVNQQIRQALNRFTIDESTESTD